MSSTKSQHLIKVLMATIRQVETSTEWGQDDQAVIELKDILHRRIDLELSTPGPEAV